jgi:hypothetical protein
MPAIFSCNLLFFFFFLPLSHDLKGNEGPNPVSMDLQSPLVLHAVFHYHTQGCVMSMGALLQDQDFMGDVLAFYRYA